MNLSALLTSACVNIGLCLVILALYFLLRKLPANHAVYFGGRRACGEYEERDNAFLELLLSPSCLAWKYTEKEIRENGGLDAVVLIRMIVFYIKIILIAAAVCLVGVLPMNYFGQEMQHKNIPSESLDSFSIANIKENSQWLWVHCVALYIISISTCYLLHIENKSISTMRIDHVINSSSPSNFTLLVRAIPKFNGKTYSDYITSFFTTYYATSYISHQMVYKTGKFQKLLSISKEVCNKFVDLEAIAVNQICRPIKYRFCPSIDGANSFHFDRDHLNLSVKRSDHDRSDLSIKEKECSAAFVFFRTRYAAHAASQVLQSSNPFLLVMDLAPEPNDVYWSNLWLPYRQLLPRRIGTLLGSILFMFCFLIPVTFVQGLTRLDQLRQIFPFLKGILKKTFISELVTGYLPSVILQLCLLLVPPVMMQFASLEGPVSYSARKKSACYKVLYFTIWNVFFVNVLSGSIINQLNVISNPKSIPTELARAVPSQGTFFITYVLTSGWTSLSLEVMRIFPLLCNFFKRYVCGIVHDSDSVPSFPYHTEVPRVLLFGLLSFTYSVLTPLILPFLLIYFILGYVVYCNQIVNVYFFKYETGGLMWPMMHNTTVFSLLLAQAIAFGVFGLKKAPVASLSIIPLIFLTIFFNVYCRQRFHPLFKSFPAQDLMDIDRKDEESGKLEQIYVKFQSTYCQFPVDDHESCACKSSGSQDLHEGEDSIIKEARRKDDFKQVKSDAYYPALARLPSSRSCPTFAALTESVAWEKRRLLTC